MIGTFIKLYFPLKLSYGPFDAHLLKAPAVKIKRRGKLHFARPRLCLVKTI